MSVKVDSHVKNGTVWVLINRTGKQNDVLSVIV